VSVCPVCDVGVLWRNGWMDQDENGMALNASKSLVTLFGTSQRLKSLSGLKSVNVAGIVIPVSDKVKILGATIDSNFTMEPHTKALSSSCFYYIRSLKQIPSSLNDSMVGSVASLLVSSHLDYVNLSYMVRR